MLYYFKTRNEIILISGPYVDWFYLTRGTYFDVQKTSQKDLLRYLHEHQNLKLLQTKGVCFIWNPRLKGIVSTC